MNVKKLTISVLQIIITISLASIVIVLTIGGFSIKAIPMLKVHNTERPLIIFVLCWAIKLFLQNGTKETINHLIRTTTEVRKGIAPIRKLELMGIILLWLSTIPSIFSLSGDKWLLWIINPFFLCNIFLIYILVKKFLNTLHAFVIILWFSIGLSARLPIQLAINGHILCLLFIITIYLATSNIKTFWKLVIALISIVSYFKITNLYSYPLKGNLHEEFSKIFLNDGLLWLFLIGIGLLFINNKKQFPLYYGLIVLLAIAYLQNKGIIYTGLSVPFFTCLSLYWLQPISFMLNNRATNNIVFDKNVSLVISIILFFNISTKIPYSEARFPRALWEAEDLLREAGSIINDHLATNEYAVKSIPDTKGHLVYGPYSKYFSGVYEAIFRIKLSSTKDNEILAKLDIAANGGKEILKEIYISSKDFVKPGTYQNFSLGFEQKGYKELEFRIYSYGSGEISSDRIDIKQRK